MQSNTTKIVVSLGLICIACAIIYTRPNTETMPDTAIATTLITKPNTEQNQTQKPTTGQSIANGRIMQGAILSVKQQILGKWISRDDANYTMTITDTQKTDIYQGQETNKDSYTISPAANDAGLELITVSNNDSSQMNYSISMPNSDTLELIYKDRGNTLRFDRAK
jgi:hypothetical protein